MIGAAMGRREDVALLTGEASYTDDYVSAETAHLAILRSQYGHARIESIDTEAAEELPGVIAVYTGADLEASNSSGRIPSTIDPPTGGPFALRDEFDPPEWPLLAGDVVRFTGEPVAIVVAEDRYGARDALDRIDVGYERLETVTDPREAVAAGAPQLHESAPDNVAFEWTAGDRDATDAAFDAADHVVELELDHQRLAPTPIEARAAIADYRPGAGELFVRISSQTPHHHRQYLAAATGLPEQQVQVSVPAVGGGFGLKNKFHPGEALAAWASVQLGRPVAWQATRTEAFRSDVHGRARRTTAALALDTHGTVEGLRVNQHADVGAYVSKNAGFILTAAFGTMLSGQYEIPAIHCRVVGAFTNAAPVDAYRGAGRPEAAFTVERLMRRAAAELGVDPVALRRRNQIGPEAFPYETPVGAVYDSGDYERALDKALAIVDYDAFRARQADAREQGTYLGIGIANLVERSGTPHAESSAIRIHPSGTVTAYVGTMDTGQGHDTTFAQILADQLGVSIDDVRIVEGDTEQVPEGTGSFGSRSTMMAGNALVESSRKVLEDARAVAAHALEASADDLVFEDGTFAVRGATHRSIDIEGIADHVYGAGALPPEIEPGLTATTFYRTETTFPFGTHVAVVEVDADSGDVDLRTYLAVDDCGVQINPKLVDGQIHGSVAQGIGQALYEAVQYNETGTAVAGSLADYALPSASQLPEIETDSTETPSPRNELGVKGIGESGCIAAPAAVVNAVIDALEPFGVENLQMPVRPETVWRAVQETGNER